MRKVAPTPLVSAVVLLALGVTAAPAPAAVTYRSASVTCRQASLYGNYSSKRGPSDRAGSVERGQVVGYQYTTGSWAVVRTWGDQFGYVLRRCITVPRRGTSGSYLWPAKGTCRAATMHANYNSRTRKVSGGPTGTVRRGDQVGYQYFRGTDTGAWAIVRKGAKGAEAYGYVLRSCIKVAPWARKARWSPAP